MATIDFTLETDVPAGDVLAAAVDFSADRPALWPTIDPGVYRVHHLGGTSAEVTEGSAFLGGIWARERYDWSTPGMVRATVVDSNVFQPGSTWTLEAAETDGRTRVSVRSHRRARGPRGRVLGALLTIVGRKALAGNLELTLRVLSERRVAARGVPA